MKAGQAFIVHPEGADPELAQELAESVAFFHDTLLRLRGGQRFWAMRARYFGSGPELRTHALNKVVELRVLGDITERLRDEALARLKATSAYAACWEYRN
ncbi:hypothetical protein [Xanthobacter sp.]|uniref:hypothetical protein n=1 Tax=Xanthobacter sp. TaxID=35809 RepID=UPI0025E2E915|nr:hypothetical protein [Xanthobacter sp.]